MQHPKLAIPYGSLDNAAVLSRAAELMEPADEVTFCKGPGSLYQIKHRDGRPVIVGTLYANTDKCHNDTANALMAATMLEPVAKDLAAGTRQLCRMLAYLLQDRMLNKCGKGWTIEGLKFILNDKQFAKRGQATSSEGRGLLDGDNSEIFIYIGMWWPTEDGAKLEYLTPDRAYKVICLIERSQTNSSDMIQGC